MNIERLNQVLAPSIEGLGYEFVGCDQLVQGHQALLRIYIDKPGGVNIDDCAAVSRQLSTVLDVEDPLEGRYHLEVSSPGIRRRLFNLAQCHQFIGSCVIVRLKVAQEGRKKFEGELKQVVENKLVMLVDENIVTFAFDEIEKVNLNPIIN